MIVKDFAKKGEDSWAEFEGEIGGQKRLIDETGQVIHGQGRLERLDGQKTRDGMRKKMVDGGHRGGDTAWNERKDR